MDVLWGFIMFFICHTVFTVFACNLYCYIQEEKCEDKNQYAMKKYLITFLIALAIYIFVLVIALLVSPFANHKGGVLIGNGIGFITGSINFRLMAEANYNKQKAKNDWDSWNYMSDEEKIAKFRKTQISQDIDEAFNSIMSANNDSVGISHNEDADTFDEEDDETSLDRNDDVNVSSMAGLFGTIRVHDEESFAQSQKTIFGCGFTPDFAFNKEKYEHLKQRKLHFDDLTPLEESKLIFPLIFGNFDCTIDLDKALVQTNILLNRIIKKKPKNNFVRNNEAYMRWLSDYAIPQILLGTIFTYRHEYIKAAYHFMLGLKTEQISINMPYCDFIRYVLAKLPQYISNEAKYDGCGFSPLNPMGSSNGNVLIAQNAINIISEMEGVNGEVIVARVGGTGLFGHLTRRGSTSGKNPEQPIDIYETYIIGSNYNAAKVRFYFNGYFNMFENSVKVASGFRIKTHSALLEKMHFVEE